jgi:dTDP-4-amino-4,6-dideoxygalactose transaminase
MKPHFIPVNDLARWDATDFAEATKCITEVTKSGHFMRGPHTAAFEQQLGQVLNQMSVVCVGNGTDALLLSLLSLGIKPGDKVATVANAGGYATGVILGIGALPVLIDVDSTTAQMSTEHLLRQIATHSDLKAVIVTHLFGLMANMSLIQASLEGKDLFLIEDCAQAIGAVQEGNPAGSWGDASTFSFYPTKNLGCLGDGGAVSFKNLANADICRRLAQYGWTERYVISETNGFNSRLDEIQAAVLLSRLERLDQNNQVRRSIVDRYSGALKNNRHMIYENSENYVGHLAVMVSPDRQADTRKLDLANVGHGLHYPVLDHYQPAWEKHFPGVSLPNSEDLVRSIITLPCFPLMTEDEISRVCEVLQTL